MPQPTAATLPVEIDLAAATPAWLDEHLTRYGGLARHVPRTEAEARKTYVAHALSISSPKGPGIGDRWIYVYASGSVDAEDLRTILTATLRHQGLTYRCVGVEAQKTEREDDLPFLEFGFQAE